MERSELEAFKRKIVQIQSLMVQVSTGKAPIADKDEEYRQLYADLEQDFARLRRAGLSLPNRNPFKTLSDFHGYWDLTLPSWEERRQYVRSLYEDVDQAVDSMLAGAPPLKETGGGIATVSPQPAVFLLTPDKLHPEIARQCHDLFLQSHYDEAILNAYKVVEESVRQATGLRAEDLGTQLMTQAFKPDNPLLVYSQVRAEQESAMFLYRGAIGCFKNPQSHRFVGVTDPVLAFELLCFASLLCRILDAIGAQAAQSAP